MAVMGREIESKGAASCLLSLEPVQLRSTTREESLLVGLPEASTVCVCIRLAIGGSIGKFGLARCRRVCRGRHSCSRLGF